ncbi:MAG TPA: DUF362 domain-containing protein [bacterium]|nr:DUF362 domain-containing protein [bacterium]
MAKPTVVVKHGYEESQMAFDAMAQVFQHHAAGKAVLLKPNAGRVSKARTGVCTNAEVVRGVIRFFKQQGAGKIIVGDGAIWGENTDEALASAGIKAMCDQEGVDCVNLDKFPPVDKDINDGVMVSRLKFSSLVFAVDLVVSIPVIKTHMYTGASLSIKNMKGCLYGIEKTRLHRLNKPSPDLSKGRCLDWGIADLAAVLMPDYALIDGTYCLEGLGPSVGTPIYLGLVAASRDAVSADYIAVDLMGLNRAAVPHLKLVQERCRDEVDADIAVEPLAYRRYGQTFATADRAQLVNVYPQISLVEKGSCSGCSAAIMTFIHRHGKEFDKNNPLILAAGKDLTPADINKKNVVLVGNCAGQASRGRPYCPGCPPVASGILSFIRERGVDDRGPTHR